MLDRIVDQATSSFAGRSRERVVRDARGVAEIVEEEEGGTVRMPVTKVLTAGIGEANLRDINVYRERGGYKQWERAVRELSPSTC